MFKIYFSFPGHIHPPPQIILCFIKSFVPVGECDETRKKKNKEPKNLSSLGPVAVLQHEAISDRKNV